MTTSACSHDTVRASRPNLAGSSASPECGPEPVTTVPSARTSAPTPQVAHPSRETSGGTSGTGAAADSSRANHRYDAATTSTIDRRKWAATVAGCSPWSTVNPPRTAWATTPPRTTTEAVRIARRGAHAQTARTVASARMPRTPVRERLPNSMYLWKPSACSTVGVIDPSTHSGQVGQPRPLPVTRTSPPVTTMPTSATRLARRMGASQRDPPREGAGATAASVLVLVTGTRLRRGSHRSCGRSPAPAEEPCRERSAHRPPHEEHGPAAPRPPAVDQGGAQGVAQGTGGEGRRDVGEGTGQQVGRDERAEAEEQHPDKVGERQHRLGAQGAGHEEGEGDERRAAEEQADERGQDAGCRGPRAERHPQRPEHDDLDPEHGQHGEGLAGEEAAAAEGGGAEQAQHAGPPVEPGRDGLARERGGHHGQRERPGEGEVHARARSEVRDRPQGQGDEGQGREDEGD